MPTEDGRFRGQGWSQARADGWTKAFGPALADDPAPDDIEIEPRVPDLMAALEASLRRG